MVIPMVRTMRIRYPSATSAIPAGLAAIAVAASLLPLTSPAAASTTPAPTAYVANSGTNTVDAINTSTNTVIATIRVGADPTGFAMTKDGATVYVVTSKGIYPINTATNKAGKVIDPAATKIALDPDGYILCALNGHSDTVTIINISTGKVRAPVKVGGSPNSIAFTPKGRIAFITTTDPGLVVSINTATRKVRTPVRHIGGAPTSIVVSGSGEEAYVVDNGELIHFHTYSNGQGQRIAPASHAVVARFGGYVLALASSSVYPVEVVDGTAGPPVGVGSSPDAAVYGPSGRLAYVASTGTDTVTPIHVTHVFNPLTLAAGPPITVGSDPDAIAFTKDGSTAYVTNFTDGTVTPINVKAGQPGTPITVGSHPVAIAITP